MTITLNSTEAHLLFEIYKLCERRESCADATEAARLLREIGLLADRLYAARLEDPK